MTKTNPNTTAKMVFPQNGKSLPEEKRQEILRTLQDITPKQIEAIGEEMSKKAKQKKLEEKSENKENGEIPQSILDYRDAWRKNIKNISEESKEKIIETEKRIRKNIEFKPESDGSMLIKMKLGNRTYKILNVNLDSHTDSKYKSTHKYGITNKEKIEVKLGGMKGDDVDRWENKELKKYVKEKQKEGLKLWDDDIKDLVRELGNQADLDGESDKIAMLMYLTGMEGEFRGYTKNADSRSFLRCHGYFRYFNYHDDDSHDASLCLIAYG